MGAKLKMQMWLFRTGGGTEQRDLVSSQESFVTKVEWPVTDAPQKTNMSRWASEGKRSVC